MFSNNCALEEVGVVGLEWLVLYQCGPSRDGIRVKMMIGLWKI